ncbi:MAG: DUF115 domain-containing protein [Parachlamydiaceae bacterium]|nr:DUF115 domain-containing protein [Parachlamydiaceae bacterium]
MEEEQFHRNLDIWGRSHPKEALLMPYIEDSDLSLCLTGKGEPNICRNKDGKLEPFHSQNGAFEEASNWFATIDHNFCGILYIYGIGLGYYYIAAKEWLHADNKRSIVFLEDDLAVLRIFFGIDVAEPILLDPQVRIVYLKEGSLKSIVLADMYLHISLTESKISALKFYEKSKIDTYKLLAHEVDYSTELKKSLLEEYLEYGAAFYRNFYQNLLYLPQSYQGNLLFGKFQKIPAIICGAGPSLEKNMHFLKQLQERALIFAGGSAINVLNSASIQPHICAGIDPNEAQNVRLHNAQAYEIPFFYRNRLNHSAFKTIHGPRLYLTGGGGYDVSKFFESRLNIEGEDIEEGENVVTFCIEIALAMECDPIILVGMDLAFTDRKTYSEGVVFDPSVEQKTLDIYANFEMTGLIKKDIYGEPIYTLWKWVAESEWMGQWAKDHPDNHLYNCTEGGLGCPGVENLTLKDAAERFLGNQYDLKGRVHAEIQNAQMPNLTLPRVRELMLELKESLLRCHENYKILIVEAESAAELLSKDLSQEPVIQSWRAALAETDLADECAFEAVLSIFNKVSSYLLNSEFEQIKYDSTLLTEQHRQVKRFELNRERFRFLSTIARINAEIIDYAFEEFDCENQVIKPESEEGPVFKKDVPGASSLLHWPPQVALSDNVNRKRKYYVSKVLKSEFHYFNGLLHGTSCYYAEQGQLLAKASFVNGILDGECLWYYLSGALYSKQNFVNGVLDGEQIYYYEYGCVKTRLYYKQGCLAGTGYLYAMDESPKRIVKFT